MYLKTMTLALLTWMGASQLKGQELTLRVCDIPSRQGHLRVAIYGSEADYLQKPVAAFAVAVSDTAMLIPCKGLPAGCYAISLFHDANDNGTLDTGNYGIPTEAYGFSRDAKVVMGPPPFEKSCFTLADEPLTLTIHLK